MPVIQRMNFPDSGEDEQILQYYTIVNGGTSSLIPVQHPFLLRNEEEEEEMETVSGRPFLFVTVGQDEQAEDDTVDIIQQQEEESQTDEITDVNTAPSFLSNLKLITLEDGRMFVTTEDSISIDNSQQQHLQVKDEIVEGSSAIDIDDNDGEDVDEEEESSSGKTEFREIRLEDGSLAMVDTRLWNDLLENIKNDDEIKRADKKFACPHDNCDKEYTTANHLTVHLRNHTGDRPYQCTIEGCDKAFATGYSLKAHTRTHTGEKPYGCKLCDKHFKTSGDLQKHVRTHTGEKPFKCPIESCGRSFTTSNIRKVHLRSHTGERPYVCRFTNCGKAFASATNFKNHMRIHSGEKPYACPVEGCGKRFTEYSSLYKHNAVHKPDKPYRCNLCGTQCKQESTLRTHKKTIHNMLITDDGTEITLAQDSTSDNQIVLQVSHAGGSLNSDFFCSDDEIEDDRLIPEKVLLK